MTPTHKKDLIRLFLKLLALCSAAAPVHAGYELTQIDALGGQRINAYGISNNGHVTGGVTLSGDFSPTAYIWHDGTTSTIANGDGNVDADDEYLFTYGTSVNQQGHAAVTSYVVGERERALYYDGESLANLGTLPGEIQSHANDLNDAGYVVGYTNQIEGEAVLWNPSSQTMTGLGRLGPALGTHSEARAINNHNRVVGYSDTQSYSSLTEQAFVWDATNGMQAISGFRPGSTSMANDINDADQIIGSVRYPVFDGPSPQFNNLVDGIDVSHFQGDVKWGRVWEAGYDFAILKATQRTNRIDPKFERNIAKGHAAGMNMGAYHFAEPCSNDAVDEANFFADVIEPYMHDELNLRPVLDLEIRGDLSFAEVSTWTREFMDTMENRLGIEPILYVNSDYARNLDESLADDYDLWLAHYTSPGLENAGHWEDWMLWQYTDQGIVPGITVNTVDLNKFNTAAFGWDDLLVPGAFQHFGPRAFIRDASGELTYIGDPMEPTELTAINNVGEVVGYRQDYQTGDTVAFVYRNGEMMDLVSLLPDGHGWQFERAWDINDDGWIVADAVDPTGEARAILLTPGVVTFSSPRMPSPDLELPPDETPAPGEPVIDMAITLDDLDGGSAEVNGNVFFEIVQNFFDNIVERTLSIFMEESSPAFTWIPLEIADNIEYLSFDFQAMGLSEGDQIVLGLGDESIFVFTGDTGGSVNSGLLDISEFQGMSAELFIGLYSDDLVGASVTIENLAFHSVVPEGKATFGLMLCGLLGLTWRVDLRTALGRRVTHA